MHPPGSEGVMSQPSPRGQESCSQRGWWAAPVRRWDESPRSEGVVLQSHEGVSPKSEGGGVP